MVVVSEESYEKQFQNVMIGILNYVSVYDLTQFCSLFLSYVNSYSKHVRKGKITCYVGVDHCSVPVFRTVFI